MSSALQLALASCLLLGFRHGFDYDHLAAITDITSIQRNWREGMRLGLLYALGHACTVAILGAAVLFLHLPLPARLDSVGERLVGATLIVLALYVLASLWRQRGRLHNPHQAGGHQHFDVAARSRIALLLTAARFGWWQVRRPFRPSLPAPEPFVFRYDRGSVFLVGIIHGLGAETPSQLLLFLLAAHLGGTSRGVAGLFAFLAGLLVMNTLMTASASGLFASSIARPRFQAVITSVAALYSFAVGAIFLFGISDRLPALVR